ncbi:MAG: SGNH/GDSL hydrolase family protein [bacterium]|nr:SGNH/GDSL hydrolase family protein [bacterium]MDT8365579.1 SGNH/GDSL hydrolase family protein [bacterium]
MSRKVYVAFGDSITDGYGVPRGFVSFLTEQISIIRPDLNLLTINAGMSGDTSQGGLYRLGRDVIEHQPDLVTINFGVNDAFSGISPVQFSDNLRNMASRLLGAGCHRLLMLSCEAIPEDWAEKQVLPYWEAMKVVAEEVGCVYADVHGRWVEEIRGGRSESDLIISGDLHPNEEGHRLIADAVFEAMESSGFLQGF